MPPQWAIEEQKRLAARAALAFDSIATEAARRQQEEQVEADRQASLRESQAASSRAAAASSAQKAPAPKRRRVAADVGWDGWRSGENELEEAIRRGRWPDNVRVGKGHVRPFLQPPYARAIADGSKSVEGRPRHGWAALVQKDDYVRFNIPAGGPRLVVRVLKVRRFGTFAQMLDECGIQACLPGFEGDLDAAVQLYRSFGSSAGSYVDLERAHGVVAVDVTPIAEDD